MSAVETYVYGSSACRRGEGCGRTRGVGPLDSPLRTVTHGSLCAMISDVPAGEMAATREDLYPPHGDSAVADDGRHDPADAVRHNNARRRDRGLSVTRGPRGRTRQLLEELDGESS